MEGEVGGSRTYANCGCPSTAQDKGGPAAAGILNNGVWVLSYCDRLSLLRWDCFKSGGECVMFGGINRPVFHRRACGVVAEVVVTFPIR